MDGGFSGKGTLIERERRWKSLDQGIEGALAECASATREGRKTADGYLEQTREAIRQSRSTMTQVASARGRMGGEGPTEDLIDQLEELVAGLEEQLRKIEVVLSHKDDDPILLQHNPLRPDWNREVHPDGNSDQRGGQDHRRRRAEDNSGRQVLRVEGAENNRRARSGGLRRGRGRRDGA